MADANYALKTHKVIRAYCSMICSLTGFRRRLSWLTRRAVPQ